MADVKQWDVFPTKIFESQFKTTEEIKKYILQQEDDMINHAPTYTKQGADNELQKSKIFKPLVEHIHSLTENICKVYEYKYDAIEITNMWVNVSVPGACHPPHTHSNNLFSGVWYPIKMEDDVSDIQFFDPRPQGNQLTPVRNKMTSTNTSAMAFPANENFLLQFPAWLMHWVPATPVKRTSVSWNVILRGEYGKKNTLQNANI